MKGKQRYTFATLRYVHDVITGEFVNVGVLLRADSEDIVRGKFRTSMGRVKSAFPSLDRSAFTAAMASVERAVAQSHNVTISEGAADVGAWARTIVPADDGSLSWGPIGSGITENTEKTLERLFERLVTQNDVQTVRKNKSDQDIWRPVRKELKDRKIPVKLERKVIASATDEIEFSRAWKNGHWHAFEPVSFDLADEQSIKDKARRWRGHLDAVAEGKHEKVQLRFIVGAPKRVELHNAFEDAATILEHGPFEPKIFREDQVKELVDEIEDEFREHQIAQLRSAGQGT